MSAVANKPKKRRVVPRSVRRAHERAALIASDAVAVVLAGLLATLIRFGSLGTGVALEDTEVTVLFWQVAVFAVPLWLGAFALEGLYDLNRTSWALGQAGRIARGLLLGTVGLIAVTFALKAQGLSRTWVLLTPILAYGLVITGRTLIRAGLARAYRHGHRTRSALVVGSNAEAANLVRLIRATPESGLVAVGCLASTQAERLELDYFAGDLPCLGSAREVAQVVSAEGIETVVIASSAFDHEVLARMVAELRDTDVDVHISSGLFEVLTSRVFVDQIAGIPLVTIKGAPLSRSKLITKRAFDIFVSLFVLLVGLPLWLTIAALIKATSPGPVFYRQPRVGKAGETFGMYKFRSMYADADARLAELRAENEATGPLFKMRQDPRVTSVGRWMRKFSLDEFPQILNVLAGQMSLVGPRPPLPVETSEYSSHHWRRLEVDPGMTGLWQVSGRSSLSFEDMVRLDLFYIENWSVALDLTIIARTVPAVVLARGAY